MKVFDRYTEQYIGIATLPDEIDFGRYLFNEHENNCRELTYSNFQTNKIIHQDVLLEKNKSLQEIFVDILVDIQKSPDNLFDVIPLIRQITNKLDLNNFEQLLYNKIFHIEEIFRQPHYLLERQIEKVNVSRAKRIPSKSYQYLASHTEDWVHKSIVSFKPSRILHEELDLNFDLYENQLTVVFVGRCLIYLTSRIKEIQDLKDFLSQYEKLLKDKDFEKGWYRKIHRNLKLIGAVYKDENYRGTNKSASILSKTEEVLLQLQKRLQTLRNYELFTLVSKSNSRSIVLRNTNVLVNHKHYRYIKMLWIELNKIRPELTEQKRVEWEQSVIDGIRAYGKAAIVYAINEYLNYEISGNYNKLIAEKPYFPRIEVEENKHNIINIKIGLDTFSIVTIGNYPQIPNNIKNNLKERNKYIITYSENNTPESEYLIPASPYEPDSIERIASLIRGKLLKQYITAIKQHYKYRQMLLGYIDCIKTDYIDFNKETYSYCFKKYPTHGLNFNNIKRELENYSLYKSLKNHIDRERVLGEIKNLVNEINKNSDVFKGSYLYCFNCFQQLHSHEVSELNFLQCSKCNCIVDSSHQNYIEMRIDEPVKSVLSESEYGMDYVNVNLR